MHCWPFLIRGESVKNIGKKVAKECSHTLIGRHLELEMFPELKIESLLCRGIAVYSTHWRVYNLCSVNKLFNWLYFFFCECVVSRSSRLLATGFSSSLVLVTLLGLPFLLSSTSKISLLSSWILNERVIIFLTKQDFKNLGFSSNIYLLI